MEELRHLMRRAVRKRRGEGNVDVTRLRAFLASSTCCVYEAAKTVLTRGGCLWSLAYDDPLYDVAT